MRSVFREKPDAAELRARMAGWKGRVWVWLPVVLGLTIIAIESTNTFSSENTSGWIRPVFERIFGHINDTVWAWGHHLARKSGHFGGYGFLCLTFVRAWLLMLALRPGLSVRMWRWQACLLAVESTFLVANLDEWHQTFIPSRTGLFSDVLLDTSGAAVMCGLVWLFRWAGKRKA